MIRVITRTYYNSFFDEIIEVNYFSFDGFSVIIQSTRESLCSAIYAENMKDSFQNLKCLRMNDYSFLLDEDTDFMDFCDNPDRFDLISWSLSYIKNNVRLK